MISHALSMSFSTESYSSTTKCKNSHHTSIAFLTSAMSLKVILTAWLCSNFLCTQEILIHKDTCIIDNFTASLCHINSGEYIGLAYLSSIKSFFIIFWWFVELCQLNLVIFTRVTNNIILKYTSSKLTLEQ